MTAPRFATADLGGFAAEPCVLLKARIKSARWRLSLRRHI
jgi:hypothetical protein